MSESKRVMDQKISNVTVALMGMEIQDFSLDNLLPLILKECLKENIYFRFSFVENTCVLNVRDRFHENYEVNQRLYYATPLFEGKTMDDIKVMVLCNTFLLTKDKYVLKDSSALPEKETQDSTIISGDKVIPKPINEAIKKIKAKGVEVNKKSIRAHVQWNQLSTDQRIKCTNYLENMGASV